MTDGTELPMGWETTRLEQLIAMDGLFSDGDWIESKDQDPVGKIRLLQLADIGDSHFLDKSQRFVNEEQHKRLRCTEVLEGDILIARMPEPLGRACVVPALGQRLITVVDVAIVRPGHDSVLPQWLIHSINAPQIRGSIELQSTGTTRRRITRKKLATLEFPLPPLGEQRRIAAKLDTTLAAVEACRQRLDGVAAILKRFRQAVLAAATSGELTREWREERGIEMDTWKGFEFSDLVNESRTGLVRSAAEQHELQDGLVPYLKMDSIGESWGCNHEGLNAVRCEGAEKGIYELAYGDWLFNTRNSLELVGKSCVWEGPAGVVFNNNILRVRFASKVRPQWVEIYFRSPGGRDMLAGVKSATTSVAAIYQRSLMALEIQVPSLEEQSELIDRVETLFTLADQLEARLTTTRQVVDRLTPALLAKAFRGELVPQDPGDEPASVLLERIRAARQAEAGAGKPSRRGRKKAATNPDQIAMEAAPVSADFLAGLLRECGPLSERALLAVSELEPQRFQQQLYGELESGTAREVQADGQLLLEAVG